MGSFPRSNTKVNHYHLRAKQGGSLYHFYDGLIEWPSRGANPSPTALKPDMLTIKPSKRCQFIFKHHNKYQVDR